MDLLRLHLPSNLHLPLLRRAGIRLACPASNSPQKVWLDDFLQYVVPKYTSGRKTKKITAFLNCHDAWGSFMASQPLFQSMSFRSKSCSEKEQGPCLAIVVSDLSLLLTCRKFNKNKNSIKTLKMVHIKKIKTNKQNEKKRIKYLAINLKRNLRRN